MIIFDPTVKDFPERQNKLLKRKNYIGLNALWTELWAKRKEKKPIKYISNGIKLKVKLIDESKIRKIQ